MNPATSRALWREHPAEAGGRKSQDSNILVQDATLNQPQEAYYPINDNKNNFLAKKYKMLATKEKGVIFGGRLGSYEYFDMDQTIKVSLSCINNEFD